MMEHLSLDELFREARAAAKVERTEAFKKQEAAARRRIDPVSAVPEPLGIFADPDNWRQTRGVTLIHGPTQTLLGNFWELRHKTVPDARRLVRSEEPIPVTTLETVDFGVVQLDPMIPAHQALSERFVTLDVQLATPAVSAARVLLRVEYYEQWTARVVLVEPTTFAEAGEILSLPAGIDILPGMTRECKRAVKLA